MLGSKWSDERQAKWVFYITVGSVFAVLLAGLLISMLTR